ncbi:Ankyrin repeat domain-containing protein 44 [Agyrium rufum]|nr:Ankyrin repeat domain-containing protein 44 [Agyrium rufum]
MDPLSITAGIIAIVGAGSAVAQTIKTVASIRGAPAILHALHNEIVDLQLTIDAVEDAYGEGENVSEATKASFVSTLTFTHATAEKLQELVRRLQKGAVGKGNAAVLGSGVVVGDGNGRLALKPSTLGKEGAGPDGKSGRKQDPVLKVHKLVWMREQGGLQRMHEALRGCRQKLISTTGLLNASAISTLNANIDDQRTAMQDQIHSHLQKIHDSIISRLPPDLPTTPPPSINGKPSIPGSFTPPPSSTLPSSADKNELNNSTDEPIQWTIPYFRQHKCSSECHCTCHNISSYRTPQYLEYFIGTVFWGYVGQPRSRLECDVQKCRKRRSATTFVTYLFPTWFLARTFQLALKPTINSGLSWTWGLGHVIPFESEIFTVARQGDVDAMRQILVQGQGSVLDIDAIWRRTPLQLAADYLQLDMCKFLLDQGADPTYEDSLHLSSSDYAWSGVLRSPANRNIGYMMEAILPSEDFLDKSDMKLIHQTTLGLNLLDLEHLLASLSTTQRDETDSMHRTALIWAARRGDLEALTRLLKYGAKDTVRDQWNMSALTCAIRSKSFPCVSALIEQGSSNVQERHAYNYTPLHQCAYDACVVEMAALFLCRGADVEARNDNGDTPLHIAIIKNAPHIAKYLLEEGRARTDTVNKQGFMPVMLAVQHNRHETLRLLLEELSADHWTPTLTGATILHTAALMADTETIKVLMEADVWNVNPDAECKGVTARAMAEKRVLDMVERKEEGFQEWTGIFAALLRSISTEEGFETASGGSWKSDIESQGVEWSSLSNSLLIDAEGRL